MVSSKSRLPSSGDLLPANREQLVRQGSMPFQRDISWRRLPVAGRLTSAAYLLPALALYALFVLWPLLRLVLLSLQQWDGFTPPTFVGLANYSSLWADPGFSLELEHSLFWLGVTLVVPTALGLGLALLLHAVPASMRAVFRALLLIPLLLPTVLIAVAWHLFYNPLSGPLTEALQALHLDALAGDWLGDPRLALPALLVVACWASYGLSMLICEAALATISTSILAAAQVDGAGPIARFWYVTLPTLRGALPLAIVATALGAVPSYDLITLTTSGGPGYATTTLALDAYGRAFGGGQIGVGAALSCLQSLVGLVLAGGALLLAHGQERTTADNTVEASGRRTKSATRVGSGLLLAVAIILAPLAWLVVLALQRGTGMTVWATLWDNLQSVWTQGFGHALGVSLCLALAVAALTIAIALPAGFVLATCNNTLLLRGAALLLALGVFQPTAVLIIPLFQALRWLGLLDTAAGLALPQTARVLPIAVLLLWIGIRNLPSGVLEAAAIDGAAPRQLLRYIAVPLMLPLLVVVMVWAFLVSWNDYLLPTVVLQNEDLQTVPLALAHFVGRFDTEYGLLATGALLALLPVLALYAALYPILARGMGRLGRIQ